MKWGLVDRAGNISESVSLPIDDPSAWRSHWARWNPGDERSSAWLVASVNPPAASTLAGFLDELNVDHQRWFRSAAQVPLKHELESIETAGADRALAVLASQRRPRASGLTVVVLCGTAITLERISPSGVWQGGAITIGLGMASRALHGQTAQLPWITPTEPPHGWGRSTKPALEAGIYWGVIGAVRELLAQQQAEGPIETLLWSGGDAELIAGAIGRPDGKVVPNLVLAGLAVLASEPER